MRSVMTACVLVVLGLFATQAMAEDKTATDLLYDDLMGRMLQETVDWYPSHMNEKSGDKIPIVMVFEGLLTRRIRLV